MRKVRTLYIGSNNIVKAEGVQDAISGAYVDDAAVVFTVYDDETMQPLNGVFWPIIMNYKAGSQGDYYGSTPPEMEMSRGQRLIVEVVITLSNGAKLVRHLEAVANYNKGRSDICC